MARPARAASRVTDTDRGAKDVLERMRKLASTKAFLTVGIHEGDGAKPHSSEATIAEIGSFHEFGLGVPRRSFIADWSDENRERHESQLVVMAEAVAKGKVPSMAQAFERLGNLYVAEIQKRIADRIEPPLSPITIQRKGSSVPLIDTGQLRSSITYVVNATGRVVATGGRGGGGEE